MERDAASAILDRLKGPLMMEMGLGHWDITFQLDRVPTSPEGWSVPGLARVEPRGHAALITLDPGRLTCEADLARVLTQQLIHVLLSAVPLTGPMIDVILSAVVLYRDPVVADSPEAETPGTKVKGE